MKRRTVSRSLVLLAAAGVAIAACGSDKDSSSTSAAPTTGGAAQSTTAGTGGAGGAVDLASVCPSTVVVQTDWFPESEHGALYQMVGEGYTVDTEKKSLTGPLIAGGKDTGVKIEIRTGGPSIGDQTVAGQTYADDSSTWLSVFA